MKKVYSLLSALLFFILVVNAQSQMGEIRGKITDSKTKKPLDYASITIELNGVVKATTLSEDDGSYIVKTLQPGEYTIKVSYTGYRNSVITDVDVISDQISFVNINMESTDGKVLEEVVIKRKKPLVDPDQRGSTKTSKEIMALPQRNANSIANTTAGVDSRAGATPNFRGARADGTAYYVDGIRVSGSSNIPQNAIDQIQVITGGTPAQYGDFIGGAIAISTKAPSRNWQRGFEFISSSYFNKYLDNSNYNELQAFISGPIKIANEGKGDKERVLLGFSLAGSGIYSRDGRLPATNIYTLNDQKQQQLNNTPLVAQSTGGFINGGEYLNSGDLQQVYYRQNAASSRFNLQGNFSYQPSKNITVRLGYAGEYSSGRGFSYYYSLLDPSKNGYSTAYTGRVYLQFTQRFNEKSGEEAKKSLINNAFYTVRVSYENVYSESKDAEFGDDIFKYGYLGKFTSYGMKAYTIVRKGFGDSADIYHLPDGRALALTGYAKQVGSFDTLLTFQQADVNVLRGNYTKQVYDVYGETNRRISNTSQLRAVNGLINGDNPQSVYSSLWGSTGTQQAGSYSKARNEIIQLYVMSEASIAPKSNPKNRHDFQFGLTFEQQFNRSYGVGANGLWNLMRLLVNNQFAGLDEKNGVTGTFDQNGVFTDTINFQRQINDSAQSNFDKNLRNKLISMGIRDQYGNPITNQTVIDPNSYDPSMYNLNMFSADELLNNGSSYVSYTGYDYLGNRVKGKPGINKFLNDPKNRTIGAYQPIYTAAWIQDKFVFKDLIVRVGVRMERFDANQVVLKDPYSMAPIYTAGDMRRAGGSGIGRLASEIPSSVGDDYAVYVDDAKAASNNTYHLSGFRNGNDWYDAQGNPVSDPNALWKNSQKNYGSTINRNTPFLVTPGQTQPTAASFTDYKADVKFLPRISFSFPISSTSQFFGTYDVLAQRPTQGLNIAQIDDYYYLTYRQGSIIGNPNLRMTQVTDYQMGFRQQIGSDAALGITLSYREFRNLLQQYQYAQAWPVNYTSYSNIDFSTVKSIGLEYELRDLGNVNLSANYLLQFADGTGSGANSSSALIQVGLPQQRNLFPLSYDTRHTLKGIFDFHYKDGKEYDGPVVGGRKIFTNAGINVIFNYVSGRPYTQQLLPTPEVMSSTNRPQIVGTPNGSRLPSQFFTDINIDKNFMFRSEGLDGKTTMYRLRVFLWVQNLFNNVNVLNVYRYTGSAYSDGYINSVQAEATLKAATNAQSMVDLYNIRVVDPANFALPRLTRLGLALYF